MILVAGIDNSSLCADLARIRVDAFTCCQIYLLAKTAVCYLETSRPMDLQGSLPNSAYVKHGSDLTYLVFQGSTSTLFPVRTHITDASRRCVSD